MSGKGSGTGKVTITLDADLAIDLMLQMGVRSPQDAVELAVRDALARGRRTESLTGTTDQTRAPFDPRDRTDG